MNILQPLLIALQFLTRLPIRLRQIPGQQMLGRSMLYYPLVGLLIGLLLAGLNALLHNADVLLRAALLLATWVLITGALHLDGLADSADAWLGGHGDHERTLAIMKDPYCGPAGVVALVVVLLIKFAAIAAVISAQNTFALIAAPIIGRTALPLLFLTTAYVRANGLGSAMAAHLPRKSGMIVITVTAIALIGVAGTQGLWLLLACVSVFISLRRLMIKRIGGATGDTAGALVEITEATTLATLALLGAG